MKYSDTLITIGVYMLFRGLIWLCLGWNIDPEDLAISGGVIIVLGIIIKSVFAKRSKSE